MPSFLYLRQVTRECLVLFKGGRQVDTAVNVQEALQMRIAIRDDAFALQAVHADVELAVV